MVKSGIDILTFNTFSIHTQYRPAQCLHITACDDSSWWL